MLFGFAAIAFDLHNKNHIYERFLDEQNEERTIDDHRRCHCLFTDAFAHRIRTTADANLWVNLGNTMEATCGVGCWSPLPTKALIDSVAKAGFNTIRIPCAWHYNSNSSGVINPTYMAQAQEGVPG